MKNDIQNRLYFGDNLEVMRKYIADESVDLCYIDPPFNSKRNYNQIYNNIIIGKDDVAQTEAFVDTWEWDDSAIAGYDEIIGNAAGRFSAQTISLISGLRDILGTGDLLAYLISMALRIEEIHRVLKNTGSLFLHCDPTASHYLKLVLDSEFCARDGEMINEIIWYYKNASRGKSKLAKSHDVIFWYAKTKDYNFYRDKVLVPFESKMTEWRYSRGGQAGKEMPKGKTPDDVFVMPSLNAMDKERLGYPTQKPLALLEWILKIASNEGDTILDSYCGCGTTIDAAQKMRRNWIGIDITYQSISLILKRLEKVYGMTVLDNVIQSGKPRDMESAIALANKKDDRVRKEFEKWAVLEYTNNRGMINDRKGADGGKDGLAFVRNGDHNEKVLFSVKSGHLNNDMIRGFVGVVKQERAIAGRFITLEQPTKPMLQVAKDAGMIQIDGFAADFPKIQFITIQEILDGKRFDLPTAIDVYKLAQAATTGEQQSLF